MHREQGLWKTSTRLGYLLGGREQSPPTVLDSFSLEAGAGVWAAGLRLENRRPLCPGSFLLAKSCVGGKVSWPCLVYSQLWPGELQDRAHPRKPLTRRVYSLRHVPKTSIPTKATSATCCF